MTVKSGKSEQEAVSSLAAISLTVEGGDGSKENERYRFFTKGKDMPNKTAVGSAYLKKPALPTFENVFFEVYFFFTCLA